MSYPHCSNYQCCIDPGRWRSCGRAITHAGLPLPSLGRHGRCGCRNHTQVRSSLSSRCSDGSPRVPGCPPPRPPGRRLRRRPPAARVVCPVLAPQALHPRLQVEPHAEQQPAPVQRQPAPALADAGQRAARLPAAPLARSGCAGRRQASPGGKVGGGSAQQRARGGTPRCGA